MRVFYNMQGDSHIQFCYLGNSSFEKTFFRCSSKPLGLRSFIHHVTQQQTISLFVVKLTKSVVICFFISFFFVISKFIVILHQLHHKISMLCNNDNMILTRLALKLCQLHIE